MVVVGGGDKAHGLAIFPQSRFYPSPLPKPSRKCDFSTLYFPGFLHLVLSVENIDNNF